MRSHPILSTTLLLSTLLLLLSGCGGSASDALSQEDQGDASPISQADVTVGRFIDDPVEGLGYRCSSGTSGYTDHEGLYRCESDDDVTFFIGSFVIATVAIQSTTTPYDLFPNDLDASLNLARLLQSIDADGDPANGVLSIDETLGELLSDETDLRSKTFEQDIEEDLDIGLIPAADAQRQLNDHILAYGGTIPHAATLSVADAGADQNVVTGSTVTLDGSNSHDPFGQSLSYHWEILQAPSQSNAILSEPDTISPNLITDLDGIYLVRLVISNIDAERQMDTVTITATTVNARPIADAGQDRYVDKDSVVTLDGTASSDADFDTLSFAWSFIQRPVGSTAALDDPSVQRPDFLADSVGTYVIRLIVDDATIKSAMDEVNITVISNTGSPDDSFGDQGQTIDDAGEGRDDRANDLVLDGDGNIYITGSSMNVKDDEDMVIWKCRPDGRLDTSFGHNGKVVHDDAAGGDGSDAGNGIVLDDAGNIYVTGFSLNAQGNPDMIIWKYTATGVLDNTFSADGIFQYHNREFADLGNAITMDVAGDIYVVGSNDQDDGNWTNTDMILWKLNANGSLDERFGDQGVVEHGSAAGGNGRDIGNAITLDTNGDIYITGQSENVPDLFPEPGSDPDMVIWKFKRDGVLDSSFDEDGIVVHRDAANGYYYNDNGTGILLDKAGNIYVTGYSDGGDDYAMVIWKYLPQGSLDTSFNGSGVVVYHNLISTIPGDIRHDFGYDITLDLAENLYITGRSVDRMAVWKYDAGGHLVDTFDDDGVFIDELYGQGSSITSDTAGDIYVTGHAFDAALSSDMSIWKFH